MENTRASSHAAPLVPVLLAGTGPDVDVAMRQWRGSVLFEPKHIRCESPGANHVQVRRSQKAKCYNDGVDHDGVTLVGAP